MRKRALLFLLMMATMSVFIFSESIDSEDYWKLVRSCFYLTSDGIYMNSGSYGMQPMMVVNALVEQNVSFAKQFSPQADPSADLKKKLAEFVGALPEEIAILRNTTEAMNAAAASFALEKGDEILTTNMEHAGGTGMWEMKADKEKLKIKKVDLPFRPADKAELFELFRKNITKKTRIITFSHITFTNGMLLPAREICDLARSRGIVTVIDGAHSPGLTVVNLHEMGCDFFASSLHKWLLAPRGVGMLYVRKGLFSERKLYPLIASIGWDKRETYAAIFETIGTINMGPPAGLEKSLEFFNLIGKKRICDRIKELNNYLFDKLQNIKGIEIFSPANTDLRTGMVAFKIKNVALSDAADKLWKMGPVRIRQVLEYNYNLIRLSTHIYNTKAEIDRVCGFLETISKDAGN